MFKISKHKAYFKKSNIDYFYFSKSKLPLIRLNLVDSAAFVLYITLVLILILFIKNYDRMRLC